MKRAEPVTAPLLSDLTGITHGFFGRRGGVSTGLFESLNCGFGSGDDPARVAENRARCAATLSVHAQDLVTVYQTHSPDVVTVTRSWTRDNAPRADAMVTNVPGMALGVLAADCAPVLAADAAARVIGAAHAGWKGAFTGVVEAMLDHMIALGAAPSRIRIAIGPSIARNSYEVGPEFRARFLAAAIANDAFFSPSARTGHFLFDLTAYLAGRIRAHGIVMLQTAPLRDTYADHDFFSFRRATHAREPDYGRNLSAIALRP